MSGAPSRVDASGSRLSSLRGSSADAGGSARRPKFVPKAAKRRSGGDAPASEAHEDAKSGSAAAARPLRGEFPRGDRARAGRGEGGRGARGGRGGRGGRGRGSLPTGKVTFVGTLSGGSSYSAGAATPAPRPASYAAADGLGISVLDDEDHEILPGDMQADESMEEQWPPVVKSVMEPMSLPLPRRPEPRHTGDVFCDENGQMTLHDDSLLFIQFPTTLPLANATTSSASKSEDDKMDGSGASRSDDAATSGKQEEGTVKFATGERFDGSIATAPGGFIGKLCIHKSGKTVLVIGDKQFDVATAQTPSVCEDVYSINPEEQQLFVLGGVERHLVVTPDFDALLA